ncbi:SNPC2 protein, partial [Origma solitaria]|nr:SNPC2 protein [Origma solitaria]
PSRFAGDAQSPERPQRGPWGPREKRALLAALRAQARLGLPEPQPAALRERLPRRSEEEVWQDLAQTLGGALEGPPSAALAQVLTVAATEPLTLRHSRPPQDPEIPQNSQIPQNSAIPQNLRIPQNSEIPQNSAIPQNSRIIPQNLAIPPNSEIIPENSGIIAQNSGIAPNSGICPNSGDFSVDFGKIYEFLARLSAGGEGPPLAPAESAVLLSLLGALPAELGALGAP